MGQFTLTSHIRSKQFSIVLWCADVVRLASFAGAHLLDEGLQTVNHGRLSGDVPIAVGVANLRRWPIISREVAAAGLLRSRRPSVRVAERHDFLLTFTSGAFVDATAHVYATAQSRVIAADELLGIVESTSPNSMTKPEVLNLFVSAARPAIVSGERRESDTNLDCVADTCQRLVMALAS